MLFTADDITIDAIGDPEAVVAPRDCNLVKIRPKGPSPLVGYNVRSPLKTSPPVLKYAGEEMIFLGSPVFRTGATVGYVEMLSGSEDFTVELNV